MGITTTGEQVLIEVDRAGPSLVPNPSDPPPYLALYATDPAPGTTGLVAKTNVPTQRTGDIGPGFGSRGTAFADRTGSFILAASSLRGYVE